MFGEVVDVDGEAGGHGAEDGGVDADAGLLHAEEERDEREVDGLVDVGELGGLDLCAEGWRRGGGRRWRTRGGWSLGLVGEGAAGEAGGDVGEGVGAVGGVDEVAVEHDVVADVFEVDALGFEGAEDGFQVVDLLGKGGVFEGGAEGWVVEADLRRAAVSVARDA